MAQVRQQGKRTPDRGHCPLVPWLVSVGTWALSLQNHHTQRLHACPGMRPDNCGLLWSGRSTRSSMLAWHTTHAKQGDSTDITKQLILAKKKKKTKKPKQNPNQTKTNKARHACTEALGRWRGRQVDA